MLHFVCFPKRGFLKDPVGYYTPNVREALPFVKFEDADNAGKVLAYGAAYAILANCVGDAPVVHTYFDNDPDDSGGSQFCLSRRLTVQERTAFEFMHMDADYEPDDDGDEAFINFDTVDRAELVAFLEAFGFIAHASNAP